MNQAHFGQVKVHSSLLHPNLDYSRPFQQIPGKVSDGFGKVSDGLGKVSDGLGKVSDGVKKVSYDLRKVLYGLGKL